MQQQAIAHGVVSHAVHVGEKPNQTVFHAQGAHRAWWITQSVPLRLSVQGDIDAQDQAGDNFLMNSSRTLGAQICLAVGLLAWVGASFNSVVHKIVVEHVVCAEHGEVVELDRGDAAATETAQSGPALHADSPSPEHDHDCLFEFIVFEAAEVSESTFTIAALDHPHASHLEPACPTRGDPLHYAPKTSPPITS